MKSKVIIIDDQRSILESMETFFRLRDWEVFTATDGLEGLAIAVCNAQSPAPETIAHPKGRRSDQPMSLNAAE